MLIVLDSSLIQALENCTTTSAPIVDALENIARARREGKHLVSGERRVLQYLSKSDLLEPKARMLYTHLFGKYSEVSPLSTMFSRYIEVTASESSVRIISTSKTRVYRCPPEYFADSSMLERPTLLCENTEDTRFLKRIAEVYIVWSIPRLKLNFEPRGGGGSTIADEYASICAAKRSLCLCVVDSDRCAPGASLGPTARQTKNVDKNHQPSGRELFVLPAREIENYIPSRFFETYHPAHPQSSFMTKVLSDFAESCPDAVQYVDVKKGLRLGEIHHRNTDVAYFEFWNGSVTKLHRSYVHVAPACWDSVCCASQSSCSCHITPALGNDVLGQINKRLGVETAHAISKHVDQVWERLWCEIGDVVASWFCCGERIST